MQLQARLAQAPLDLSLMRPGRDLEPGLPDTGLAEAPERDADRIVRRIETEAAQAIELSERNRTRLQIERAADPFRR